MEFITDNLDEIEIKLLTELDDTIIDKTCPFTDEQIKDIFNKSFNSGNNRYVYTIDTMYKFLGQVNDVKLFVRFQHNFNSIKKRYIATDETKQKYYGINDTKSLYIDTHTTTYGMIKLNKGMINNNVGSVFNVISIKSENYVQEQKHKLITDDSHCYISSIDDTEYVKILTMIKDNDTTTEIGQYVTLVLNNYKKCVDDKIKEHVISQKEQTELKNKKITEHIDLWNKESKATYEHNLYSYYGVSITEIENNVMELKDDKDEVKYKYVLDKNFNEVLEYDFWTKYTIDGDLDKWDYVFIENKISYKKYVYNDDTKKLEHVYSVNFDDDIVKINNVKIPKAKVIFFLKRVESPNDDRVKFLKKLNGRKLQLLELNKYSVDNHYNLPCNIDTNDGNVFSVTMFGKNITNVDYDDLEQLFFCTNYGKKYVKINGHVEVTRFFLFAKKYNVKKSDVLSHIQKVKTLNTIGGE